MPALVSRSQGGRRTISEINMVPFIDVMLVLLIIFMVTAPLITPSLIDLPTVGKAKRGPDRVVQIVITRKEALELRAADKTTSVTLKDLVPAVRKAQTSAESPVVIGADKSVKYETVVRVMDALQRAGIKRVGLSVQMVN